MDDAETYLQALGLHEEPFAPTADPAYFHATANHEQSLRKLWNSIDARHGMVVVLGNYGTGKTTLLRKIILDMAAQPHRYVTAVIGSPIPSWTSFALLEAVVAQFGLHPKEASFTDYLDTLYEFLLKQQDKVCTLIIDDAQNLNKRGQLELLRLVQNLETQQHKLLNVLLFAQLEWNDVLNAAPNFQQRINLTQVLHELSVEEVGQLVDFRLRQAGATAGAGPHFSGPALAAIHAHAEGSPRVVITLCRNVLLAAAEAGTREINHELVIRTIEQTTVQDAEKRARVIAAVREATKKVLGEGNKAVLTEESTALRERHAREQRAAEMLLRGVSRASGEE